MQRYVTFDKSCRYELPDYNSLDVNKLFGLSFGWGAYKNVGGPGYIPPVHWNSARFGWRWSRSQQCIELLAYCYVNGKRNWDEQMRFPVVTQVQLGEQVECMIQLVEGTLGPQYGFSTYKVNSPITGSAWIGTVEQPHYGFTCGLYFGGSQPASHDIHVTINR